MLDGEQALAVGLVDEVGDVGQVTIRAGAWLEGLLHLPSAPMLATRAVSRSDLVAALNDPARIDLPRFLAAWNRPDTQASLKALVARLGK
mgnify:CR=1 FL=1